MPDSPDAPHDDAHAFGGAEPARDVTLGALLGDVVGAPPFGDVDWTALAARITTARARQRTAWWSYATRWEGRAIPVAVAAGLVGVLALWGLGMPGAPAAPATTAGTDPIAAMVDGTPAADAARTWARSLASDDAASAEGY